MLRRAQCAVLNPSAPESSIKEKEREVQRFVRMSEEEVRKVKNKLKFSANAVCLDLRGPDLTDLAFVDLPGKFLSTEATSANLDYCENCRHNPECRS